MNKIKIECSKIMTLAAHAYYQGNIRITKAMAFLFIFQYFCSQPLSVVR